VYSIDKIVQNFTLRHGEGQRVLDKIAGCAPLVYKHWTSAKPGSYKEQFSFEVETGGSFWAGIGLNTFGKAEWASCRLEWNPNKVGFTRELAFVHGLLAGHAKRSEIKQFDLAVDIPVERSAAVLVKDGRLYEETTRSADDRTQYAGQRNAPGRVKLYNKTREAGLCENVTRVELTIAGTDLEAEGPEWPEVRKRWPRVLLLTRSSEALAAAKLTGTDKFIFKTLLDAPERLPELGRRMRKKFEALLLTAGGPLEFDPVAFGKIVEILAENRELLASCERPVFARKWWDVYPPEIFELTEAEM